MDLDDLNFDANESLEEILSQEAGKSSKLRRSCESCRKCKARCNPIEANPERCQRCTRDDKKCIFLAAKARPKRATSSKARVLEMEQKLDGLMALLQSQSQPDVQDNSTPAITPPPLLPTPDLTELLEDMSTPEALPNMSSQRQDVLNSPNQFGLFGLTGNIRDNIKDVISKDIISYNLAEEYLRLWRSNSIYFPFVVLPAHLTLDTLRRDRPFLLLSILCFSAAKSHSKLAKVLDQELRESLSRKIIVNGEKSLDLLQGLLNYIAWYHLYFDLQRQQIYQLTQMAIGITVDLEIYKPTQTQTYPRLSPFDLVASHHGELKVPEPNTDAKRALLGCYVLTSSVCQSLRKPTNMKYKDYFGQCCSAFAQNPEMETDIYLQYYVRLQHFQEEVNAAFDYDAMQNLRPLDAGRIEILLRSFNRQLIHFEESFPPEVWVNVQLSTTFYGLRIYLHEIGFHASPPSLAPNSTYAQSHMQSWYYSNARTESLLACLQATKTYLDRCLLLPSSMLSTFTLPDFIRIIYALLILSSFARLNDFPRLQELANLLHYLNAFHGKTTEILKIGTAPECFLYLDRLFQASGIWLTTVVTDPMCMVKFLQFHQNILVDELLPKTIVRSIWCQGTSGRVEETCSDQMPQQEQWEELDMLNNWPAAGADLDEELLGVGITL